MQFHFHWDPAQIDSMTPAQISSALTDIVSFFRYMGEHYANRLAESQKKVDTLRKALEESERDKASHPLARLLSGVIFLALAFLLRYLVQEGVIGSWLLSVLAQIAFVPLLLIGGILLIMFVSSVFAKRKAVINHPKLVSALEEATVAHKQIDDEVMAWATKNRDCLVKAKTLLPDYYEKEDILLGMIQILNNHRATTLGGALTLYLAERQAKNQADLLSESVAAQNQAAAAAARAAAAAESAAASAQSVAADTTYLRNK